MLLASDHAGRIVTDFIINEPENVVAVRKSRQQPFPMLIHPSLEIASNAGIENSIVAVGQNVDAITFSTSLLPRHGIPLPGTPAERPSGDLAMTPDPVIAGSGARRNLCEIAALRSR